jgi:hypothetical protein
MTQDVNADRLADIFFPYAQHRTATVKASGDRFVYYTTAAVATDILKSQKIWFRNASLMNDFQEIGHGSDSLINAYKGPAGAAINSALASCFPELIEEVERFFIVFLPVIRNDTYLFCVSEHLTDEDARGRLSMWRAYGGSTGVAIVMNGSVMHASSDALGVYSSPVLYGDALKVSEELMLVAARMQAESTYLKTLGKETVRSMILTMMHFAVLCTKHPGFQEELEWRVVASPMLYPAGRREQSIEVIRGVPQTVVKISLTNDVERGLTGLAIPELIDRIIIGPCQFPFVTALAFQQLLVDAGISDADKRVIVTDIPLRHSS